MNNKSRRILYLIAGGYLVYLGVNLISAQLKEPTSNAIVAWGGAIVFIVFGAYLVIDFVRKSLKDANEEAVRRQEIADSSESETEEKENENEGE